MAKYELFHPDTEILGQAILDFGSAIGFAKFGPILEEHGLTELEADQWYPARPWVDVLNELAEMPRSTLDFVSMGMQQMALVQWPPEFDEMSLIEILETLDDVYHMNYRGTDPGGIDVRVIDDHQVDLIIRSFEPDDLWYGNIYGLMKRFAGGRDFTVQFVEDQPRRDEGGETTTIRVLWE